MLSKTKTPIRLSRCYWSYSRNVFIWVRNASWGIFDNRIVWFLNTVSIDGDELLVPARLDLDEVKLFERCERCVDGLGAIICDGSEFPDTE